MIYNMPPWSGKYFWVNFDFSETCWKTLPYPQDAELLNLTENLGFCKDRFSGFAYTMISAVAEETRLYLFNANKLISSNFVLLAIEKGVSHCD